MLILISILPQNYYLMCRVWCMRPQYMACQKYTLYIYCKGFTLQIIVVCGVFRYNISAESPAKSILSQGHGLSTGGVSIYIYVCVLCTVHTSYQIRDYIGMPFLILETSPLRAPMAEGPTSFHRVQVLVKLHHRGGAEPLSLGLLV